MAPRYDDDDDDDDDDDFEIRFDASALDDDEDQDDDEETVLRIEAAFRSERARVRACRQISELRAMRSEHEAALAGGGLNTAALLRTRDLIELIDDRVTDIKAQRRADRPA